MYNDSEHVTMYMYVTDNRYMYIDSEHVTMYMYS